MKVEVMDRLGKNSFWVYYLDNQVSMLKDLGSDLSYWDKANQRDEQMATNLRWLLEEKYKNEKIIVWAANGHVSKYSGHYPNKIFNPMVSMGTYFCRDTSLEAKTYILGFTSHHGTAGRLYPPTFIEIPKLEKDSYENWVNPDYTFAFTDFKKYNHSIRSDEVFFLSGGIQTAGLHKSDKAEWNRVFDGMFFIREMYRCKEMKMD
jgi:erythromycin esterase-like protein